MSDSDSRPFLSIVIPAYNELENFNKGVLDEVEKYINNKPFPCEIIVVDDGSGDGSPQRIRNWIKDKKNWRLIQKEHQGKALTVAAGIKQATGKYILFTDFDQATPISEVEKLLPFMKKGYEIAIGSREVKGSKREKEPWYRHLMGRGWNVLVQLLALRGIHDTQCGFKLFKGAVAHQLFNSLRVYHNRSERDAYTGAFDVELLYIAQKRKMQIAEVPVWWKHIRTDRVDPIRDSLKMLVDLLRIRLADLRGEYED